MLNSSISLLRIFIYNRSIQKNYLLSGFGFAYFESHQSYLQFFSGFEVFGQLNKQIPNGKKALFAIT
jgi:hypothetical protein